MTEDGSGLQVRQSPRKRSANIRVADFTMMVRVPGQPAAVDVYTDDDREEAERYAQAVGGAIVPLPLPLPLTPPAGYTASPSGSLIPIAPTTEGRPAAEPSVPQDAM